MSDWFSQENLKYAWRYAKFEIRDDFIFDIINYEDIKVNEFRVLSSLEAQLKHDQYHPSPLIRISVPKNEHSVRPGSVIHLVDLIVVYALIQQLVPQLDSCLSDSVYSFRLNPKATKSQQHLFKDKNELKTENNEFRENEEEETAVEARFPYGWFLNWKAFHSASKIASESYDYVALTDITAYFENISLDLLREILKEKLNSDVHFELANKLFCILEFWDWNPNRKVKQKIGLPQGNDISSFLSNIYLLALDKKMLEIVSDDTSKYFRYVDDIKLFTSDKNEAKHALFNLEETLRTLNLNVQSAKTEIKSASNIIDKEVEYWLDKMGDENPEKHDYAIEFFENSFNKAELARWQRPYSRCLTVLGNAGDDRAKDIALELFLSEPSQGLLIKHFKYLRSFVTSFMFEEEINNRLSQKLFIFPYHKGMIYRLLAHSRGCNDHSKKIVMQEAIKTNSNWFCRMSALFCLVTFSLDNNDLAKIAEIVEEGANPQVSRAAFVTLCQYAGDELNYVLDRVSLFNAPHQDYLRRYFLQLTDDNNTSKKILAKIKGASVNAPTFIHNLHQLDLLKANKTPEHRSIFRDILDEKITNCEDTDWLRLSERLQQIRNSFIVKS